MDIQTSLTTKGRSKNSPLHYKLNGNIHNNSGVVTVTVQLIRSADDAHLWSDTYETTYDNIHASKDMLSSKFTQLVANQLWSEFIVGYFTYIYPPWQVNGMELEKEYFSESWHQWVSWYEGRGGSRAVQVEYLEKLIEIDPNFPLAYGMMVSAYSERVEGYADYETSLVKARWAVDKLLELTPEDPQAVMFLAQVNLYLELDYKSAMDNFRKSQQMDPSQRANHQQIARIHLREGRMKEALVSIHKATELKAGAQINPGNMFWGYYQLGEFDSAFLRLERSIRDRNSHVLNNLRSAVYLEDLRKDFRYNKLEVLLSSFEIHTDIWLDEGVRSNVSN
jgi:tetratricopeptide (TPR) repeat protein